MSLRPTSVRAQAECEALARRLQPLRDDLLIHPIYKDVHTLARLRCFMEGHAFAVWDFMTLVKRLQRELCGTELPWTPPRDACAARFINDLVLGEESDLGPDERPTSHLEGYLAAMAEVGADAGPLRLVLHALAAGQSWEDALGLPGLPEGPSRFSRTTLQLAAHGRLEEVAAAFLFAREDVIPDMFQALLDQASEGWGRPDRTRWLRWYLERHIELDGESHGPIAQALLARVCGTDAAAWARAEAAARGALEARIALWDDIVSRLPPPAH